MSAASHYQSAPSYSLRFLRGFDFDVFGRCLVKSWEVEEKSKKEKTEHSPRGEEKMRITICTANSIDLTCRPLYCPEPASRRA